MIGKFNEVKSFIVSLMVKTLMEIRAIPKLLSILDHPVGLGGCRNTDRFLNCCEYNISVFDGKSGESVCAISDDFIKIHHCSLEESDAAILTQLENLTILNDDQWKLRMLLTRIKDKKELISKSFTQSCLVDAGIFANKAKDATKTNDPFAGVWIKCASYFLADALLSLNSKRISPSHMLETIRSLKKVKTNAFFSLVHEILGIERTSTSVLLRMVKSTIGFSDIVENNGHSKIIQKKYEYMVENSLLSDCYFYLGYINRNNLLKVKNRIHKNPQYIHVLKIALDIENDPLVIGRQSSSLLLGVNQLLGDLKV